MTGKKLSTWQLGIIAAISSAIGLYFVFAAQAGGRQEVITANPAGKGLSRENCADRQIVCHDDGRETDGGWVSTQPSSDYMWQGPFKPRRLSRDTHFEACYSLKLFGELGSQPAEVKVEVADAGNSLIAEGSAYVPTGQIAAKYFCLPYRLNAGTHRIEWRARHSSGGAVVMEKVLVYDLGSQPQDGVCALFDAEPAVKRSDISCLDFVSL